MSKLFVKLLKIFILNNTNNNRAEIIIQNNCEMLKDLITKNCFIKKFNDKKEKKKQEDNIMNKRKEEINSFIREKGRHTRNI